MLTPIPVFVIVVVVLSLHTGIVYAQRTEPNIATNGNVYMELQLDFEGRELKPMTDRFEISFTTKNLSSFDMVPNVGYFELYDGYEPYFYLDNDANVTLDNGKVLVKKVALYIDVYERELNPNRQDYTSYWGYGILDIEGNRWPVEGMLEVYDRAFAYLTVVSY